MKKSSLTILSVVLAFGHDKAWFVSSPFADHGRAFTAGVPYVGLRETDATDRLTSDIVHGGLVMLDRRFAGSGVRLQGG